MYITRSLLALTLALAAVATADDGPLLRMPLIRNPQRSADLLSSVKQQYRRLIKRDGFQAPLYNDQGSQYLIQVGIGTPPQNFTVTLDTGSADLWVPSSKCPQRACPFSRFDESQSSTFKSMNEPFGIQYGIGSVNGTYVTDTVTVAGASIQNQQFGLATTSRDILTQPGGISNDPSQPQDSNPMVGNGILGLGYPQLTAATTEGKPAYNPFVFNLVKQNVIQQPVFSIYLNSASKQGWAGEIVFGGTDSSKYSGDLVYMPVVGLQAQTSGSMHSIFGGSSDAKSEYFYWMVYGQGLAVKNAPQQNPEFKLRKPGAFILDTGTTLTYLPSEVATEIATSIVGSSGFQVDRQSGVIIIDCAAAQSPATVQLMMLQSADINSPPVVLNVPASELVIPLDGTSPESARTCLFGIAPTGGAGGLSSSMFLIGDSFLRSAYLVFDMGNNRVGIATANGVGGSVNGVNNNASSESQTSGSPISSAATVSSRSLSAITGAAAAVLAMAI